MNKLMHKAFDKTPRFLVWVILTIVICGISTLASFQPVWANLPLLVLPAICLLLFSKMVFFEKMKLTTLVVLRIAIVFAVFNIIPRDIYIYIVLAFLMINILEATMTDFKHKSYFNFVTGLFLTASVLVLFKGSFWSADKLIYEMNALSVAGTICWIVSYTLWNWIFVAKEFSDSISYLHFGILLSPLVSVLCTMNPGYWLVFRANSLTFGGVLQIANKEFFETKLQSEKVSKFITWTKKKSVQCVLMIINIVLMAVAVVAFFL